MVPLFTAVLRLVQTAKGYRVLPDLFLSHDLPAPMSINAAKQLLDVNLMAGLY